MIKSGTRVLRAIPIALAGCALAALSVQNATVMALRPESEAAAKVWPGHPSVETARATREIAAASGAGKPIDSETFALMNAAAASAPLAPQPFIVAGIRAQLEGQAERADRAFEAARLRDPRSLPARYFLATNRLQRGDVEGLREIAALTRLDPNGGKALVPYLAAYASQERARGAIRDMFRNNHGIRNAVLGALASDPDNVGLVLSLGGTTDPSRGPWLKPMIDTLIAKGRIAEAHALWEKTAGTRSSGIFDADFRNASALPPFNWDLTSSSIGLAERRSGALQIIFYGQEGGTLARQLLLLPAGRYRVGAPASGSGHADSLQWVVRCEGRPAELARVPAERDGFAFAVPADCQAQWLELVGRASDIGREVETSIGPLSLERIGAQ